MTANATNQRKSPPLEAPLTPPGRGRFRGAARAAALPFFPGAESAFSRAAPGAARAAAAREEQSVAALSPQRRGVLAALPLQ